MLDEINKTSLGHNSTKIDEICNSFSNDTDIRTMCDTYLLKLEIKNNTDLLTYKLVKTFYPFLLIFGLFGNTITFLTMIRIYKRRKNYQKFCFSLATLALADLVVLIIGCLREYLEIVFGINIRTSSVVSCKLIMFFCYLFSFFSVYLHGFIAVERWLAVSDPIKSKAKFTFKMSKIIILAIFLTCILLNLPLLYYHKLEQYLIAENEIDFKTVNECKVTDETALLSIDSLFYCLIPFVVTILFSFLTVVKLIQSKTTMKKSNQTEVLRTNSIYKSRDEMRRISSLFDSKRKRFNSTIMSDTSQSPYKTSIIKVLSAKSCHSSNLKITIMLMALPICYIITTFPIFVIIIYGWFLNNFGFVGEDGYYSDRMNHAHAVTKIFMYIHNSINILIYIFFGKSFRQDFIGILPFKNLYNKLTRSSRNNSNFDVSLTISLKNQLNLTNDIYVNTHCRAMSLY